MQQSDSFPGVQREKLKNLLRVPRKLDVPKHVYLFNKLKEAIETEVFPRGDRFPTERQLTEVTPFSLGTVQRAVRSLVESKLVVRKRRLGTFVFDKLQELDRPWHLRFADQTGRNHHPVFPKIVKRQKISSDGIWAQWLPSANHEWTQVDRLINVNDEFFAYSKFFVRSEEFPALLEMPLDGLHNLNFRVFLEQEYRAAVFKIEHQISFEKPHKEIRRSIGVNDGVICTAVEIFTTRESGENLYYQKLILPPNNSKYLLRPTFL